jgi:hypothetical protein
MVTVILPEGAFLDRGSGHSGESEREGLMDLDGSTICIWVTVPSRKQNMDMMDMSARCDGVIFLLFGLDAEAHLIVGLVESRAQRLINEWQL